MKQTLRMALRPMVAMALGGAMAMAMASDVAQSEDAASIIGCHGPVANITLYEYDGPHLLQMCVSPQGLRISGGVVNLNVYDGESDGLFHNGFEPIQ